MRRLAATAEILPAERAERLLTAHADVDRMKAEAQRLLASASETYEIERSKGALAGQRAGAAEAQALLDQAEQAVRTLIDSLQPEIALLAVAVAERILGAFEDRELMARAAARAIADLRDVDKATLYVAPRYFEAVRNQLAQHQNAVPVALEPAAGDSGACTVVTARGSIDASIGRQLEVVRQTVRTWGGSP